MMRRRNVAVVGIVLAALIVNVYGQDLRAVEPESVGLSTPRLRRLERFFQGYVDEAKLAGLATLIVRRGKVAHFKTYGFADIQTRRPLSADSIFRIYSMTKPIIGVAMMMLFEEGKYQLTDPVSKYIPEFKGLKVDTDPADGKLVLEEADHEMTVRELMTHTSGLTYGVFSKSDVDTLYEKAQVLDRDSTLKDMIRKLSRIPLRHQPGSLWHYSVSVDVQGYLIEVLSGQPLDEFLRGRIFEPLRMVDTGFYVPASQHARLTTAYGPPPEGEAGIRVVDHPSQSPFAKPPLSVWRGRPCVYRL